MPAVMGDTRSPMNLSTVSTTEPNDAEEMSFSDDTAPCLSDDEICMALGLGEASNWARRQVGAASRTIYETTKQWPWEWVGFYPPKFWRLYMVQDLAQLLQHVARGAPGFHGSGTKPTFEDVKTFIRKCADSRGKLARFTGGDIQVAGRHFGSRGNASESVTQEKKPVSRGRSQADVEEQQDEEHVDNSIAKGEQNNCAPDTDNRRNKEQWPGPQEFQSYCVTSPKV